MPEGPLRGTTNATSKTDATISLPRLFRVRTDPSLLQPCCDQAKPMSAPVNPCRLIDKIGMPREQPDVRSAGRDILVSTSDDTSRPRRRGAAGGCRSGVRRVGGPGPARDPRGARRARRVQRGRAFRRRTAGGPHGGVQPPADPAHGGPDRRAPHRPVPLLLRRRGPAPRRTSSASCRSCSRAPSTTPRPPPRRSAETVRGRPSHVMAAPGPSAVFDLVGAGAGAGWLFDTTCDRLARVPLACPAWAGSCAAAAGPSASPTARPHPSGC